MPDKNDQERRRQIMLELQKKQQEEFESTLPMSRKLFEELFNYLDEELGEQECNDTLKLTEAFLSEKAVTNISIVKQWLSERGAIAIVKC